MDDDNKTYKCMCEEYNLDSYSGKGEYIDAIWDIMFECNKRFEFLDIWNSTNYIYEAHLNCVVCMISIAIIRGFMWECLNLPSAESGVTDRSVHDFCTGAKKEDIEEMRYFTKKHMSVANLSRGVELALQEWSAIIKTPFDHEDYLHKIVEYLTLWSSLRQEVITEKRSN